MTKIHLFLLMLILPLKFAYPDYGYFPLQMDYSRKYLSPHPFMPSSITFTESIVSALMIEGEHYYLFNHYRLGENVFFREWNNCVYVRVESTAHLLYDFSANAGDSWNAPDPPNAF